MNEININVNKWSKAAKNLHSICDINFDISSLNDKNYKIIERIGSNSTSAEVYRLRFALPNIEDSPEINKYIDVACKILPIISDKSLEDNEKEISIATQLSQEVRQNKTIYFPIVYDTNYCQNTLYNKNSLFYDESLKYNLIFPKGNIDLSLCDKLLIKLLSDKESTSSNKKRIFHKYRNLTVEEIIKDLSSDDKLNYLENIKIPSNILISEMCYSDLREYLLTNEFTENFLYLTILHVMNGIKYLNETMNIIHGDLHTANILLKVANISKDRISFISLIHDFGKSKREMNKGDINTEDVEKFLYDLNIMSINMTQNIRNKISKTLEFIKTIKINGNIMDNIINYFQNY